MRRQFVILISGLLLGAIAFAVPYFGGTAAKRTIAESSEPGLEWLKTEFRLDDAEFRTVAELHKGYQPECRRLCALVAEKDHALQSLVTATNRVTPEIERLLREKAELRSECQAKMLAHFYAVSQRMSPAEGKRYLEWVQGSTLESGSMMAHGDDPQAATEHHH